MYKIVLSGCQEKVFLVVYLLSQYIYLQVRRERAFLSLPICFALITGTVTFLKGIMYYLSVL